MTEPAVAAQAAVPSTVCVSFSAEIVPKTTESLLRTCAALGNQGVKVIYLLLSTPGGSVMCGMNAYNVLNALPVKLITHNVGNVDSIGNVVFLAGDERYACSNATFMFHGVVAGVQQDNRLDQKSLREKLGSVQADNERIASIIGARSQLNEESVSELFLEARTKDPAFAKSGGIIHDIRDVQLPTGTPVHQLVFDR